MGIQQVSIFLENKSGRLSRVAAALSEGEIAIKAMVLADTADFGVLHLIADSAQSAMDVLKNQGFTVCLTEVLAVKLKRNAKEMDRVMRLMNRAGLNIEYMYAFSVQSMDGTLLVLKFDQLDKAKETLQREGIPLLTVMP